MENRNVLIGIQMMNKMRPFDLPSDFYQVRLLLNTNKLYIMKVILQYNYINWFIYPRQGIRHYTKFTLNDKIKASKKLKDM